MGIKYRLLRDYNGFAKGAIITVAGQHRFDDMNKGYGVPYVEPKPKVKPKSKVTSATVEEEKPKAKEVDAPAKDKQVKKPERNKQGKFQSKTK